MTTGNVTDNFVRWKLTSWEEAIKLANKLPENWIFRGQRSHSWGLASSLERYPKVANRESSFCMRDAEELMLDSIKRQKHIFLTNPTNEYDDIDYLALLQHHGAVTRLLDFSRSFYVASFFAIENAQEDSVLWAIDKRYIGQRLLDNINISEYEEIQTELVAIKEQFRTSMFLHNKLTRTICKYIFSGQKEHIGVVPIEPYYQNQRIIIQQGLFLFPLGLDEGLEYHLCDTLGITGGKLPEKAEKNIEGIQDLLSINKPKLIRIEIPKSEHNKILCDLKRMNITAATLFPGLDGFARSLNYYASGYRAMDNRENIENR